ncbi:MAG TPA: TRAP transporter substrate-binding protein [archaeon]|nr:TRAP transporter substrate-binding protein [archaeon]
MRKGFVLAVAVLAVLGLVGAAQAGTLVMKAAHYFDDDHAWNKGLVKFRDVIRAKSNGTLDLEIYNRGVLGSEKDYIQNMMQGALDMSIVSTASAGGFAKELTFLDLMFIWKDVNHWQRALDGDVGKRIAEVIEKGTAKGGNPGLKILGYFGGSPRHIISRKQGYSTVADLAGFKIRVQDSPTQIEMWKLLGTIPAVVPYLETYNAIQTGVVDGMENEMSTAFQMKFHEVGPYITETSHIITVRPLFMSGQTWQKLTPDQQKIVLEAAKEGTAVARSIEWKQNDEAVEQMKKVGTKFYTFKEKQKMMDMTLPIRQRVAKEVGVEDIFQMIEREGNK